MFKQRVKLVAVLFGASLTLSLVLPACSDNAPSTTPSAQTVLPTVKPADLTVAPLFTNVAPEDHLILPKDLPAPFATQGVNNGQHVIHRPQDASLHVPPGFEIRTWVTGMWNPRWIQTAPNGDLFVAESQPQRISIIRASKNGSDPQKFVFAEGLTQPFGIAFYPVGPNPKYVYVGDTDEVVRFPYHNGDTAASGPPEKIMALTPGGYNQHWTRTVVFSPDNKKMYVSVGSQANVDNGEAPPRACVMVANPDGTDSRVFASGLRNAVGLTFNPDSGALWAAVNERDQLGNQLPPDYVTSVKDGGFYGWPYMYIGNHPDPRVPTPDNLPSAIVPDVLLESHCAALSIEFYDGHQFPKEYYHDGFAALHGSWNRLDASGYKIVRVPMNSDGTSKNHGYQDFIWGWNIGNGAVWGRPVSIAFLHDGSMVVSDDGSGTIWRVTYKGK